MSDYLETLVESREELKAGTESFYDEQEDGKFILKLKGIDNHPDVHGLKSAYQKEKDNREQLEKQYKGAKRKADMLPTDEEVDAGVLRQVMERLKAGENLLEPGSNDPPDNNKPDPAKIKADIEKRFQKQLDDLTEGVKSKDQKIRRLVVDSGLTGALAKNKVTNPTFQRAAKRLLEDQIKVSETEDGGIVATVETDMGEVSLDQFVQNWAAGEEGSAFVDGNSGSGAPGSKSTPKGKKQITRDQLDKMDHYERSDYFRTGGTVVD